MFRDVIDHEVPAGTRILGYAVVHPGDRRDFPRLLSEHCERRSWDLDGVLISEDRDCFGGADGEWRQVLHVIRRLSIAALITPSLSHLASTPGIRRARLMELYGRGIAVRTLPRVTVRTP